MPQTNVGMIELMNPSKDTRGSRGLCLSLSGSDAIPWTPPTPGPCR